MIGIVLLVVLVAFFGSAIWDSVEGVRVKRSMRRRLDSGEPLS